MAERIGNEHGRAVAPDADQTVGRSEINADDHGAARIRAFAPVWDGLGKVSRNHFGNRTPM